MSADNVVLLFILVWTFMAVCQADKDGCSVTCENVTGFVGKEVTLTCSVSHQCTACCITHYMFRNAGSYNDSTICKQVVHYNNCEHVNNLTCSYTPTTKTEKIRFFGQATCGTVVKLFTVDTTGYFEYRNPESPSGTSPPETAAVLGYKFFVIAVVLGCFIIIIFIILTIIHKKKPNFTKPCGFQRIFLCIKHDEDNSDHPEDVI